MCLTFRQLIRCRASVLLKPLPTLSPSFFFLKKKHCFLFERQRRCELSFLLVRPQGADSCFSGSASVDKAKSRVEPEPKAGHCGMGCSCPQQRLSQIPDATLLLTCPETSPQGVVLSLSVPRAFSVPVLPSCRCQCWTPQGSSFVPPLLYP